MTFADASFDAVLCIEVLEHVADPFAAARELARVLRPDGRLLLTTPFLYNYHGKRVNVHSPNHESYPDYWRFTKLALSRLLSDAFGPENVIVEAHGNVAASGAFLYGVPADRIDREVLYPHDPDYEMVVCGRARRAG